MSDFLLGVVLRGAGRSAPGRPAPRPAVVAGFPVGEATAGEMVSDEVRTGRERGPANPADRGRQRMGDARPEPRQDVGRIHTTPPDAAQSPGSILRTPSVRDPAPPETAPSAPFRGPARGPAQIAVAAAEYTEDLAVAPAPTRRDAPPAGTEPLPGGRVHEPTPPPVPPPASPPPVVEPRSPEPPQPDEPPASEPPAGSGRIEVRIGRLELRPESPLSTGSPRPAARETGGPPGLALARRYLDRVWR